MGRCSMCGYIYPQQSKYIQVLSCETCGAPLEAIHVSPELYDELKKLDGFVEDPLSPLANIVTLYGIEVYVDASLQGSDTHSYITGHARADSMMKSILQQIADRRRTLRFYYCPTCEKLRYDIGPARIKKDEILCMHCKTNTKRIDIKIARKFFGDKTINELLDNLDRFSGIHLNNINYHVHVSRGDMVAELI